MNRSEFVELIIRLGISAFPKMAASLALQIMIGSFLQPIFIKYDWLHDRDKHIQSNRPLNKLLYENRHGLQYIYNKRSDRERISRDEVCDLITDVTDEDMCL